MNKLKFFKVIDLIDDDLIKEAEIKQKHMSSADSKNEKNITVSGVELYHESKWQKYALIAAVFLLVAGLGAGGALMFRNRPPMLDDPALPSDISETNETSPFEKKTDSESATETKKKETTTKESTNKDTAVTIAVNEENKSAVTTDSEPVNAETNMISQSNSKTVTTQADKGGVEEFVSRAQQFPVVTSPDGSQQPIATKPKDYTFTEPSEPVDVIIVTKPTEPVTSPAQPEKNISDEPITFYCYTCPEMFEIVRSLSYMPYTCDGLPDTSITDSDGTVYQLNFRERWVWRNGKEEAHMPDRLYQLFCGDC
ncbi:hypothetical protein [Ruminococcus flavefaciens]|uniref:Uncharacterized protein n=1 Tax=Ruminococcus flavefaciens TaxID=1265 RepID=A0A1M7K600_RUMFL|nr:hypothetical protein [Ruminococcus flavefaciens]SHM60710.1 hypothetical protein SAMN04487860_107134 [Ruminococcus flavefaciens]